MLGKKQLMCAYRGDHLAGGVLHRRGGYDPRALRYGQAGDIDLGAAAAGVDAGGLARGGLVDGEGDRGGGQQVGADEGGHEDLDADEHRQGHRHRGDGAAQQQSGGGTQGEGEGGVAERDDVAGGEGHGCEPVAVDVVERPGPPGQQVAEQPRRWRSRRAPTPASLTASHRVRVTLWFQANWWVPVSSFTADQRGAPEDADQRRGRRSRGAG